MLPSSPQQQPGAVAPSVTPPSVAAGPSGPSQFQVPEVQRPSALSSVIAPTFGAREASAMNPFQRNVMPKRKGLRLSAMYNPYVQGGLR
jgi:hypothetical protein